MAEDWRLASCLLTVRGLHLFSTCTDRPSLILWIGLAWLRCESFQERVLLCLKCLWVTLNLNWRLAFFLFSFQRPPQWFKPVWRPLQKTSVAWISSCGSSALDCCVLGYDSEACSWASYFGHRRSNADILAKLDSACCLDCHFPAVDSFVASSSLGYFFLLIVACFELWIDSYTPG